VLKAEVEIAVREVHTSYRETQSKYVAMRAADTEVSYLFERWRLLPGDDRSASFLLEDLLDAQNRLAAEEFGFAEAQFAYTVALAELNRVTGTLLKREQITPRLIEEDGLPRTIFEKPTSLEFMRGSPAPHDASGAHTAQR
jgi:outer membrane protein TolC